MFYNLRKLTIRSTINLTFRRYNRYSNSLLARLRELNSSPIYYTNSKINGNTVIL